MSRPADWKARENGRDPTRSWIVQAPAGSGKTELLTQRMLALLARVNHPEEVVAITFTRKAAAEMNGRLMKRLQQAGGSGDEEDLPPHEQLSRNLARAVLENDARRGWNLLRYPGRLRIRTIDSLCSELARQLPILSGLGGGQQIAEDAETLYRQAAARTMAAIEDDEDPLQADVTRLLARYDNQYDRLIGLLTGMLGRRDQWLTQLLELQTAEGFDRHGLEQSLRFLVETQLHNASERIPDFLLAELPAYLDYSLANKPADEADIRALMAHCYRPDEKRLDLPTDADALPHWLALSRRLLTADGKKWRSTVTAPAGFPAPSGAKGEEKALRQQMKSGFVELLQKLSDDDGLRRQLAILLSLPDPRYEDEAWEALESLMRVLVRSVAEWNLVMTETGETDFSEVAWRAIHSLGEEDQPSNLALRMDYRIQHLLVDEFQDTSHSQIRLLNKLTAGWQEGDGRTLFLVGDPMQSIYRFRKAEVSLFIEAFAGRLFDHIELRPLELNVNFRSNRPIVDWVNAVFPSVMPARSDPVMGAVRYSASASQPDAPEDGGVSIQILPQRDEAEEAQRVIAAIEDCDPSETVAILVRSRNHASGIMALLDRLKRDRPRFRYQAIDFNPLAETPLVRDLVSLTLALAQPADRLAWLAALRAPFTGFGLADLETLAGADPSLIIASSLGEALDTHSPSALSPDGRQRLERVAPVLLQALGRRGRESVRSLVESSWIRLGGPACLANDSELRDAANFFKLIEALENQGLPIDRDNIDQRLEKLYAEPDATASGKLQLMTIYAAKGLQFDTVILPGLNRGTGNDQGRLLHWFELAGQDRIVMAPMRNTEDREKHKRSGSLIQYVSQVEKQRQALEDGRLLYVAATRAIKRLFLAAAVQPRANDEIAPVNSTLLAGLWPAIGEAQRPLIREAAGQLDQDSAAQPGGDATESELPALPQLYRRLAPGWNLPPPPDAVIRPAGLEAEARDYIEFRWAGEEARLTGNLVHRLLQLIAERGMGAWQDGGGMKARENWCRQQLTREGVTGDKAGRIVGQTRAAISNCLESERGQWLLQPHDESRCEYALTAVIDGSPRQMVLDRSFVDAGTRWIIDYKTSSHRGGDLEGFLRNEADRYREQLGRYRQAMALSENRPIRTALYFPLLNHFLEV